MDRAEGSERKGGRLWASFPREVAGASGSRWRGDPAARRASPLQPVQNLGYLACSCVSLGPQTALRLFFFLMYCQYFKTGRFFFQTRIFRLSFKSPKLWLHRVSLPPGTWRGHLSCLCPHHEGHVSGFL